MIERSEWLKAVPGIVAELRERWSLIVGSPFDNDETSCAWAAAVTMGDGSPAVLKIGWPHYEAEHEIEGLRFWNGNPTVRLMDADDSFNAMLLERCEPGAHMRSVLSEPEQDVVIATLLRRLWQSPGAIHPFRQLSEMISYWSEATLRQSERWRDSGLVREGLNAFQHLLATTTENVLLATDLHAGNILQAEREPWLVIDPKPFLGDPAYDATQHLLNCRQRLKTNPEDTLRRFAALAGVDYERLQLWLFARIAAEPRDNWSDDELDYLAGSLVIR